MALYTDLALWPLTTDTGIPYSTPSASSASLTMAGKNAALLTLLFQPALLLIDFGHFQYNSAMLGVYLVVGKVA
jgi:ALG6, ALG8 glycosyltransferase family